MITRLTITRLGRFLNRSFDLGRVTVFVGKNEAGKSTVFDALFGSVCSGGSAIKTKIRNRYDVEGLEDVVQLEAECKWEKVDAGIFKNFFAIRTADLEIEFDGTGNWVKRVTDNLFTGGIDPRKCAGDLRDEYKDKSTTKYNKEFKSLQEKLSGHKDELRGLEGERARLIAEEERASKNASEFERNTQENSELLRRLKESEDVLQQQELIQELTRWRELKNLVAETKEAERELSRLTLYASDNIQKAKEIERKIRVANEEIGNLQILAKSKSDEQSSSRQKLDQMKIEALSRGTSAQKARVFINEIDSTRPVQSIRTVIHWKPSFIIIGTILILVGIAGALLINVGPWNAVVVAVGILVGVITVFLGRTRDEEKVAPDTSGWCASIRDRWTAETGVKVSSNTPEGLRQEMQNVVNEHEFLQKQVEDLEKRQIDLTREIDGLRRGIEEKKADLSAQEKELEEWLRRYDVRDLEAYRLRVGEYKDAQKKLDEMSGQIVKMSNQTGLKRDDTLEQLVDEKIFASNRLIHDDELASDALKQVKDEYNKLKDRQKEIAELIAERGRGVGQEEGKVRGALEKLPDQIASVQLDILMCEREISRMIEKKTAAIRTAEIWEEVASDSEIMFRDLSVEMADRFREITKYSTGDGPLLTTIKALSKEEIEVRDAGGGSRTIENLSSATFDAFYLAARLTLALRMKDENRAQILLLDDPFLTFDEERTANAIKLLKAFQEQSGWQLLFFTKDRRTLDQLRCVFLDLRVHDLDGV
jgi:DNA repair exonuclease SbcCD ATPase subunit